MTDTTDRQLLERAARAVNGGSWHPLTHDTPNGAWNPLTDDGDALRLAVKLNLDIEIGLQFIYVVSLDANVAIEQAVGDDPAAATRRAITRAAASMDPAPQRKD